MLCPVQDQSLLDYLRETVLGAYLRDTERAAVLDSNGQYGGTDDGDAERFSAQAFLLGRHTTDYA